MFRKLKALRGLKSSALFVHLNKMALMTIMQLTALPFLKLNKPLIFLAVFSNNNNLIYPKRLYYNKVFLA